MEQNLNEEANVGKTPMDEWFKESMEAFHQMMESAQKIIDKEEKNDDTVG